VSTWTINGAAVAIHNLTRKLRSLAVDTVTFETAQNFDDNPILAVGTVCAIQKDGALWFTGIVTEIPAQGTGRAESQQYEVSGPWWFLEKLVFHQSWKILTSVSGAYSLVSTPSTRVILGQDISGNPMGIADQINEILTWAISQCGAPIAAGTIDQPTVVVGEETIPVYPPANEQVNITCAEAIKAMLRWIPDAIGWWDYTQATPVLNIRRAANLTGVSVALQSACTGIAITPRSDLRAPSVCINYEQTTTVDTDAYTQLIQDYQPGGATGLELGALCATIELSGPKTSYQHQPVVTVPVPGTGSTDADSSDPVDGSGNPTGCAHWWRSHLSWMRQYVKSDGTPVVIPYGDISIVDDSHYVDLDANWGESGGGDISDLTDDDILDIVFEGTSDDDAGTAETAADTVPAPAPAPADISDVPRELVSGEISAWMSVKCAPARACAWATYTPAGTPDPNVAALFGAGGAGQLPLQWGYTATDAETQTYRKLNGYNAGEAVPQGVAAMLYAAVGMLYYEGKITSEQAEVSGAVGLGNALNLIAGREEWASMNAPVQTITEEVDAGKTEVGFGPPSHLSPQDLVELLRGTRRRRASSRGSGGERSTGTPGKSANVMGPTGHPITDGTPTPSLPSAVQFPFAITAATTTDEDGNPQLQCAGGTILQADDDVGDDVDVDGISDAFDNPGTGNEVWIEIDIDDEGNVTSASLENGDPTSEWDNWPSQVSINTDDPSNPYQQTLYILVAELVDPTAGVEPGTGTPVVVDGVQINQLLTTNLRLTQWAFDGVVCLMPEPWSAASTL